MSSPPKIGNGAEKYNVRQQRLARKLSIDDDKDIDDLPLDVSYDKAGHASGDSSANNSFISVDVDSTASDHLENTPAGKSLLDKLKAQRTQHGFAPTTPSKIWEAKAEVSLPSGHSGFSSSASSSPAKKAHDRLVSKKDLTPTANAMAVAMWRKTTPLAEAPATPGNPGTPLTPSTPWTPSTPGNGRRVPFGVFVTEHNAQKYYSTKECLFVANLNANLTDAEIKSSLYSMFTAYGSCYVKVQRDKKQMPQAFIQYTDRKHAEAAIRNFTSEPLVLDERRIRVEWSKANGEYHLERIDGAAFSEEDARFVLERFGAIDKFSAITGCDTISGYKKGLFVTFQNYQNGRDALKFFEASDIWNLQEADRTGTKLKSPSTAERRAISEVESIANDRNSIFIGNIRQATNEGELRKLCSAYGIVQKVEMITRPSHFKGCEPNTFAFVQFSNVEEAKAAVEAMDGLYFIRSRIKVALKKPLILSSGSPKTPRFPFQERGRQSSPLKQSHVPSGPMGQFSYVQDFQHGTPNGKLAYASPQSAAFDWQIGLCGPAAHGHPAMDAPGMPSPWAGVPPGPPMLMYQVNTESGVQYIPVNSYGLHGPPSGHFFVGVPAPPMAAYPYSGHSMPQTPALTAAPTPTGSPPGPTAMSPPRDAPMLENGAEVHVITGGAANDDGAYDLADTSFGRGQDLSSKEAKSKADGILDKYLGPRIDVSAKKLIDAALDLEAGVLISPTKVDAPNQSCAVFDIIGGPDDGGVVITEDVKSEVL